MKSTVSVLREDKHGAEGPDASALHIRKEKSRTRATAGADDAEKEKKDKKKR